MKISLVNKLEDICDTGGAEILTRISNELQAILNSFNVQKYGTLFSSIFKQTKKAFILLFSVKI